MKKFDPAGKFIGLHPKEQRPKARVFRVALPPQNGSSNSHPGNGNGQSNGQPTRISTARNISRTERPITKAKVRAIQKLAEQFDTSDDHLCPIKSPPPEQLRRLKNLAHNKSRYEELRCGAFRGSAYAIDWLLQNLGND